MNKLLIDAGDQWTETKIMQVLEIGERLAKEKYNLQNLYPNQIQIVTYEHMLDIYSAGFPLMYEHWSFGERFVHLFNAYNKKAMGLAYEVIFNSNPCISYLMEQNSMVMQAMVTLHAPIGHNYVYANNCMFKEWTDAEAIIDYLEYAKNYIKKCEEKYGTLLVESTLDAAHAIRYHGIDRYKRPQKLSAVEEEKRREERERILQKEVNELWNTLPNKKVKVARNLPKDEYSLIKEPQENILYFLEKHAPRLEIWQREILRIIRKITQYFYPQMCCKLIHESFASYMHYNLMYDLFNMGHLTDGAMQEFIVYHTMVTNQPDMAKQFNPYAGWKILKDIERISTNPTDEDRAWFKNQDWVGNNKPYENIKWAVTDFNDESFILQFLSPQTMRDFKMMSVEDDEATDYLLVTDIQNEEGYKGIRKNLSKNHNINAIIPNIQITEVDIWGDRTMMLEHIVEDGKMLDEHQASDTLNYLGYLWGYRIILQSIDKKSKEILVEWETEESDQMVLDLNLSDL
jgi:stage V sporulation protein R